MPDPQHKAAIEAATAVLRSPGDPDNTGDAMRELWGEVSGLIPRTDPLDMASRAFEAAWFARAVYDAALGGRDVEREPNEQWRVTRVRSVLEGEDVGRERIGSNLAETLAREIIAALTGQPEVEPVTTAHRVFEKDGQVVVEPPIRSVCRIWLDRLAYVVQSNEITEQQLRDLPSPRIPDDFDIWLVQEEGDDLVRDCPPFTIRDGDRFYTTPSTITAGAALPDDTSAREERELAVGDPRTAEQKARDRNLRKRRDLNSNYVNDRAALDTAHTTPPEQGRTDV